MYILKGRKKEKGKEFSVQCAVYIAHCALCSVQWRVCRVKCSVYNVQCAVYSVPCEVFSVQCAVCSVKCTVCSVQCTVYRVQCTVCSVQWVRIFITSRLPPLAAARQKTQFWGRLSCVTQSYWDWPMTSAIFRWLYWSRGFNTLVE